MQICIVPCINVMNFLVKFLFFSTNNNKENIYCEYKGKISNFLTVNKSLYPDLALI